jgi:hypothetical protein
LAEVDDGVLEG